MDTFGYFLYGSSETYWAELRLSILSLLREAGDHRNAFRVVVICDKPGRLDGLPVELEVVGTERVRAWAGSTGYAHRAKLEAMAYLLARFPGRAVLIDTDTYFVGDPKRLVERIEPGRAVMHAAEGKVGDDDTELAPRMGAAPITLPSGALYTPSPDAILWNSGVAGMHSDDGEALADARAILDELYRRTGVFSVEQFALGEALTMRCDLSSADDVIVHYWGMPRYFLHARLTAFEDEYANSPWEERLEASSAVVAKIPSAHPFDRTRAKMRRWMAGLPREYVAACLAAWSAQRSQRDPASRRFAVPWERVARYHWDEVRGRSAAERSRGRWASFHGRYLALWLQRDPALRRFGRTISD